MARCDNPKKCNSRLPSAFGQSPAKRLSSVRRCTLKKCSGQTTSGRLLPTDCEAPQVACCDSSKNSSFGLPPAFGRSPAKSLASVRKCTLKRRSGQTTSGCLSTPTARLPKRPAAITRKSTAPNCLRLLVNPFRKISPAARCDNPKKYSSRQLSALGRYPAKSHSSLWKCTPKKRSRQTAFGF